MQTNIRRYEDARTESDIDLVSIVTNLLKEELGPEVDISSFTENLEILDARTRRPDVQRFIINKFFRIQLCSLKVDTMRARQALIPEGDISRWIEYFRTYVIPYCVDHHLPKDLYAE